MEESKRKFYKEGVDKRVEVASYRRKHGIKLETWNESKATSKRERCYKENTKHEV